jgi:hypothetical protein
MYVVIIEVGIKDLKPRLSYLGVLTTKQLEEFQFVYIGMFSSQYHNF